MVLQMEFDTCRKILTLWLMCSSAVGAVSSEDSPVAVTVAVTVLVNMGCSLVGSRRRGDREREWKTGWTLEAGRMRVGELRVETRRNGCGDVFNASPQAPRPTSVQDD